MNVRAKKKLAFVDHSFHKATRSSDFFLTILKRNYEVTQYFDQAWRGGAAVDPNLVNDGHFDVVFFWQVLPFARNVMRLSCKNVVWAPMYDEVWRLSSLGWRVLRRLGLKIICFSKALHQVAQREGIDSFQTQYFPEAREQTAGDSEPSVFFWQRVSEMNWPLVKRILAGNDIKNIVLKVDLDPGHLFCEPDPEDFENFDIELIRNLRVSDGGDHEDYMRLLSRCNVFIAPRLREGIGLSFLEAMARGMCVVAPDAPTMNEYITSGDTGFLFNADNLAPLDLTGHRNCGERARALVVDGHAKWLASVPPMLDFIARPSTCERTRWITPSLLLWDVARRSVLARENRARNKNRQRNE